MGLDEIRGASMSDDIRQRIAALEAELDQLKRETGCHPDIPPSPGREARPAVSRRRLLSGTGVLAAGAAGVAVIRHPSPAAAGPDEHPATDISFTPTGSIAATNVQAALAEVDGEKAALAGAWFTGPTQLTDARFMLRPWIDIRAHGAVGNGVVDDGTAIRNAINAAANTTGYPRGGTVLLPPGKYRFTGLITVPDGVDLWGCGGHGQGAGSNGTVLQALDSSARIVITGTGGQTGNFVVDGARIANPTGSSKGLVFVDGVVRQFTTLRVAGSLSDGLVIENAQNCTFTQCNSVDHAGNALVLDSNARSSLFLRCDFGNSQGDNILIRHTNTAAARPTNNVFIRCAMERGYWTGSAYGGNNSQLHVTDGWQNAFYNCGFTLTTATGTSTSGGLVLVDAGDVTFINCDFFCNHADVYAVRTYTGFGLRFQGHNTVDTKLGIEWLATDCSANNVLGRLEFKSGVTTKWSGHASYKWLASWTDRQQEVVLDAADNNYGLRLRRAGEGGFRYRLGTDGAIEINDGVGWDSKATWKLLSGGGWHSPHRARLDAELILNEMTAAPADPSAGNQATVYVKGDKLVVAYKEGSTMRYRYMLLTGTTATWTHTTTAP